MNVDSSSSSYSSNNGLSGLVSGMDTDSMVNSMLSGIQTKIDKQKQEQQVLTWKQEKYREVITKINDFQDKYFSLTSSTSLRSTSIFNSSTAQSNSSAVKIISAENSADAQFSVNVKQLASAASVTSKNVSTNSISVSNTASSYSRKVTFSYKTEDKDDKGNNIYKDIEIDLAEIADSVSKDADGNINKAEFANKLNEKLSAAGITVEYKPKDADDEKSYDSLSFSASTEFKVSGSGGGLAMIGYAGNSSSSQKKDSDGNPVENSYTMAAGTFNPDIKLNGKINIALDGVSKTFTLEEGKTIKDIKTDIEKAFGSGISITDDGSGNTVISANGNGRTVSITGDKEVLDTIGMTSANSTSRISLTTKLSEVQTANGSVSAGGKLNINGTEIEYSADDTIAQVLSKVNNSGAGVKMQYNALSDNFSITNSSSGSDFALSVSDDGNLLSALGFNMSGDSVADIKVGTNAVMDINGVEVERAGNKIAYEGVTFEVKSVTAGSEPATITSEKNVDKIMSVIKDFVNDYNTLIGDLNKYTHEEATYKEYPPLTDAQKKEMTEREIELWEEKSKTGLLRNDSDISKFLQNMRAAMYTKGSDSSLVLSNIGIDSSSNWREYGKLSINEDTLKKALENNSEEIADMFTNVNSGLGTRLNDICKQAANTSSGSPGSLVSLAGVVGKATEKNNTIYDELQRISDKLKNLNTLYEKRKNKYWKIFNSMETSLANYSSQSDYLSQMTF